MEIQIDNIFFTRIRVCDVPYHEPSHQVLLFSHYTFPAHPMRLLPGAHSAYSGFTLEPQSSARQLPSEFFNQAKKCKRDFPPPLKRN